MLDFAEMAQRYAERLHEMFVVEYEEPMNGDDIADVVAEFEGKLKELSGDNGK